MAFDGRVADVAARCRVRGRSPADRATSSPQAKRVRPVGGAEATNASDMNPAFPSAGNGPLWTSNCNDDLSCTINTCTPGVGCSASNIADGEPCSGGTCQMVRLRARVIFVAMPLHHTGVLEAKLYTVTRSARGLAFISRLSSGWPTSSQWVIWPVRSFCQRSGSSVSHRLLANSSAPWSLSDGTLSANASTRIIMRSSVSDGWRAIVTAWSP